ncbi:aminodeoxychorismate lyase [Photobacterium atrarenae]|uniref:Aminodeoxychorismate lyase n=1 Tax=Photobacterium atrarenae TaxID=865757 RepID=A0ABY5GDV8_9GAMM|nr:aminodeoxychorismate lyase [Photobacterium atrarenae]UTV26787.1 aminodeoxychorismate lyase [Photobacterium atrarenae]
MILINGVETDTVTVADRALQYGDGCFTTILVEQGQPRLWPLHLQRLQNTLAALRIAAPDWQALAEQVHLLAAAFPDKGGVKVLISRGAGGRGYSPAGCLVTQVIVSDFAWPAQYLQWQQHGIALGVCRQRLSISPMLAGLKHLNRLEQVLLKQEAQAQGWLDAVVLDAEGYVAETIASNLFWRQGQTVFTPALESCGVHGVMRAHVLSLLEQSPYCIEFVKTPLNELLCADEVFITNAVMALVPVNEIEGNTFTQQTLLHELKERLYAC